jgi:hypothetical protein
MAHHTSFTLNDCLSECDLSAPGASELRDLRVIVLIPDAYGVGSEVVQVDKIVPIAAGVIDKARGNTAFRTKLGSVLTSQLNFEARACPIKGSFVLAYSQSKTSSLARFTPSLRIVSRFLVSPFRFVIFLNILR